MAEREETVDIPDPERVRDPGPDRSAFDPGADEPAPEGEPRLGEDPAFDPGGQGRQPDIAEDAEEHG